MSSDHYKNSLRFAFLITLAVHNKKMNECKENPFHSSIKTLLSHASVHKIKNSVVIYFAQCFMLVILVPFSCDLYAQV